MIILYIYHSVVKYAILQIHMRLPIINYTFLLLVVLDSSIYSGTSSSFSIDCEVMFYFYHRGIKSLQCQSS